MVQKGESKVSIIAAIVGNILIGVVKFIAAAISGSSAMVSEGIHSIVDSGNGLLILHGIKRSDKKPDREHPFGYGKELYFWTLVVSVLIFAVGGGVSVMKGVTAIMDVNAGATLGDPTLSYIVLAIATIIEGVSLTIAVRQFKAARGDLKPLAYIRECKDPSLYTVVLEDSAAEAGLLVAFFGILIGHLTGNHYLDGVASIIIGLLLMGVSIVLLVESKGLLIGEGMRGEELDEVDRIVESDPNVENCGRVVTMYIGPYNLLMTVEVAFKDGMTNEDILCSIHCIEQKLVERFPQTTRIFIESQSLPITERQHIEQVELYNAD